MIYFSTIVTATVSGQETKLANCNHCGEQYAYVVQVTTSAEASAPYMLFQADAANRAQKDAARQLERELEAAVDPVPCPNCAYYSAFFATWLRKHRFEWMWNLGLGMTLIPTAILAFFIAIIAFVVANGLHIEWSVREDEILVGLAIFAPGLGLLFLRKLLISGYDPNSPQSFEQRRKIARGRAWSLSPPVELQLASR